MKLIPLLAIIFLFSANSCLAQNWRSIKPLYSTRADVINLLGKPLFEKPKSIIGIYDIDEGRLNFMYSTNRCVVGLPADWGIGMLNRIR
jgi:hypothetical protein